MPAVRLDPLDVGVQIPHHFRCPISLELMTDPVTVSTGQTYDRSSIESWIATGNATCPVARVPLDDFTLIPNHTLRRLIQNWCVANRSFGVERIPTPKQPADPVLVRSLLNQAVSASSSVNSRLNALRRIKKLATDSEKNRSVISSLSVNVREMFLGILFSSESEELAHESLAVLAIVQLSESESESVASDLNRVDYLAKLLSHSSMEVRVNSAALIEIVLAGIRCPELRRQVCSFDEIFDGTVSIIRTARNPCALRAGIRALFALCLVKHTRHKAVDAGAAEALIDRFAELEKCEVERALATVELLCRIPSGRAAFARHALTVAVLVKAALKVSERATEYAAGSLVALCTAEEECRREAVRLGVVTQMLLVVQSECTERAKRKAHVLLKLLTDSDCSFGNCTDNFACSEVVVLF